MDELQLLMDLHRGGARQGPGGDRETNLAIELAGIRTTQNLRIADIGCGTGASTLLLAKKLDAKITAVDFLPDFLAKLDDLAAEAGLSERIQSLEASMDALPFEPGSFDVIWSEGAIYNMGFENGITAWREFLKPGGILAVSELTWLTEDRPQELQDFWAGEYPDVDTASAKIAVLERLGFTPIGYFPLDESCWVDNFYRPLQQRFDAFLDKYGHSPEARATVASHEDEIVLYEQFSEFFSYGFYVARRSY